MTVTETSRRLAVKPHLRTHVISASEVALIGERERYAVRGELYAAVLALLDGSRRDDDIAAALADRHAPEHVYYALAQLEAKGYVGPAQSGMDAAWWSAHGVTPEASATVAVAPIALVDAGAQADALARLRAALAAHHTIVADVAKARLAVVVADDYLDPRLGVATAAAAANCAIVLPARLVGEQLWLGPAIAGGDTRLFDVLLRRLAANRPVDMVALKHGAQFPLHPAQALPQTLDLGVGWISAGLAAVLAGPLSSRLHGAVLTLDPWTLESWFHAIATALPVAGGAAAAARHHRPVTLRASPKRHLADGGHRSCPPEETLARLEPFVSPISGIIPRIEKLTAPEGVHVYAATQTSGVPGAGLDFRANRMLGRPLAASGKGESDTQARVSCLAEAIERYSCGHFGDETRRTARLGDLGDLAIDPRDLMQFSDDQYRRRDATNVERSGAFTFVPMRFDPTHAIDWTPAWSLTRGHSVFLPSGYCYFRYPVQRAHDFCRADSNGCASGNTIEEAILQGLLELIERDACAIWWYNLAVLPGIELASFASPYLGRVVDALTQRGRDLHVLDLTNDLGVTTVMAVSAQRADGGRVHLGLGCHLSPRIAVSRALTELMQAIAFELSPDPARRVAFFADHAEWLDTQHIHDHPYLRPRPGAARTAQQLADVSTRDIRDDVHWCVDMLAAKGLETIVLDHTRPEIGFPVVRVAVPGLRHFWSRFAPGRLYDVPPQLGWHPVPLDEAELNPVSFFF